jgi:outer membrane protein assembly factor BamB/beta-lactamase regulating signal transducer with metallopeptidase domain
MNTLLSTLDQACLPVARLLFHFSYLACIPAIIGGCLMRSLPQDALAWRYRTSLATLVVMVMMLGVAAPLVEFQSRSDSARRGERIATTPAFADPVRTAPFDADRLSDSPARMPNVGAAGSNSGPAAAIVTQPSTPLMAWSWKIPWASITMALYVLGLIVFATRLARGIVRSRVMRRNASRITQPAILSLIVAAKRKVGLHLEPSVCWCEQVVVPTVAGVLRPIVLIPASYANQVSIDDMELVLLHEFHHLRRGDAMVHFLQNVTETLFFFHPLVWWTSGQVRLYRELRVDQAVVSGGVEPQRYAATLIDVVRLSRLATTDHTGYPVAVVTAVSSRSHLRTRLQQLMSASGPGPAATRGLIDGFSLAVVVIAMIGVAVFSVRAIPPSLAQEPRGQQITAKAAGELSPEQSQRLRDLKPTELAGVVLDADGRPMQGVTVDCWTWVPGNETTTDADGVFRFTPDNSDGEVEMRIARQGYSPFYNPRQSVGGDPLIIRLDRRTFIEGTVVDPSGKPAAKVVVRGEQRDIDGPGVHIGEVATETTTDEQGKYRLYVHPDVYYLSVTSSAGVARVDNVAVVPGDQIRSNIQLDQAIELNVDVVDVTTGEPFAGLVLFSWRQPQFKAFSDDDGKLVMNGLLPGKFEFNVGAGEPVEMRGQEVYLNGPLGRWWSPQAVNKWQQLELQDGQFQRNVDDLTFDLQPDMSTVTIFVERGVTFSGKVLDPDGNPVAGATVAPAKTGSGNSLTGDTRYSVKTETDGSYRVVMPAGNKFEYNLIAHDGEYSTWRKWGGAATQPMQTTPGQEITDVDLTLTLPATVRGKVAGLPNDPRQKVQVRAQATDMRGNRYYDPTTDVAADGSFEIQGIRPGEHMIQVSPFWLHGAHAPPGTSVTVTLNEGETRDGIELQMAPLNQNAGVPVAPPAKMPVVGPANPLGSTAGGKLFTAQGEIFSAPCFDEQQMFFGACDGNFYCLDKRTGDLIWKKEGLTRVDSNPLIHDGAVFFAAIDDRFFALDTNSGQTIWEQTFDGCGYADPQLQDGKLVLCSARFVLVLNPKDGKLLNAHPLPENRTLGDPGVVAIANEFIVTAINTDFGFGDSNVGPSGKATLACFAKDGTKKKWSIPLGGVSNCEVFCDENHCFVGTRDGLVSAYDLKDGKIAWQRPCGPLFADPANVWPSRGSIDTDKLLVFVVNHQDIGAPGALVAVNKADGQVRWSIQTDSNLAGAIMARNKSIIALSSQGQLFSVGRDDGSLHWSYTIPNGGGAGFAGMVTDGHYLYTYGDDKSIYRFDIWGLAK